MPESADIIAYPGSRNVPAISSESLASAVLMAATLSRTSGPARGSRIVVIVDPTERAVRRQELLEKLRNVKWDKGQRWEGIAGKFTPKGRFSLGGSKETAYAVYAALTDASTEGYARIRS